MSSVIHVDQVLTRSKVIPVATIEDANQASAIGDALLRGGIGIIEVTLRTASALQVIEHLRQDQPDMIVGAGTVWTAEDWVRAESAGAQFMVSPGAPEALVRSAAMQAVPYLPGAQTPTEVHALVEAGFDAIKFFPAGSAGGVAALKAMSAVFPGVRFCPTGGVSLSNMADYLALRSVPCVGGSWLLPAQALADGDWARVSELAREAVTRM
jgi:2-dehydro-3-deoxyphosphogluconate aldolase/(4S)-4-hydroxy-2-oxoglutarate aldolase